MKNQVSNPYTETGSIAFCIHSVICMFFSGKYEDKRYVLVDGLIN